MIDHRIILQILHSHLQGGLPLFPVKEKREWVSDNSLIIFPSHKQDYERKINQLNAIQYLQRMRLLYTVLLNVN